MLPESTLNIKKKISIIGSGFVGSSIAYALILKNIADEVVLVDINKTLTKAETLDIRHGISAMGSSKITDGDYCDIKDSDLIIVTAGRNRQPNETRLNLSQDNIKIANSISEEIKKYYNKAVVLVVSNPVDVITYKMAEWLALPKGKVFGTGCILDSSRFVSIIAEFLGVTIKDVDAVIIGEHGESQVHLWSKLNVKGIPIEEYCKKFNIVFGDIQKKDIEQKVVGLGTEIIKGKGRTNYGIATCVCHIADSILNNKKIKVSLTTTLNGEYGINDVALSLPCIISTEGIEEIFEEKLSDEEYRKLQKSASAIKAFLN